MDKTSEKTTKDPKRVEAARNGREKYMNKFEESILNDAKKVVEILPMQTMKLLMQAMKLPALPTSLPPMPTTTPLRDQMILMSMALVCLRSLPLVFVYFLHLTLTLNYLSMTNSINYQKDVICFRSDDEKNLYNKWLVLIIKKTLKTALKMD